VGGGGVGGRLGRFVTRSARSRGSEARIRLINHARGPLRPKRRRAGGGEPVASRGNSPDRRSRGRTTAFSSPRDLFGSPNSRKNREDDSSRDGSRLWRLSILEAAARDDRPCVLVAMSRVHEPFIHGCCGPRLAADLLPSFFPPLDSFLINLCPRPLTSFHDFLLHCPGPSPVSSRVLFALLVSGNMADRARERAIERVFAGFLTSPFARFAIGPRE